jgi:hypothetical protein
LQINRQNLKWYGRMGLIVVLVALAEGLVGVFARKPFPWVAVIPCLIPLLSAIFVIIPMMREEKPAPPPA